MDLLRLGQSRVSKSNCLEILRVEFVKIEVGGFEIYFLLKSQKVCIVIKRMVIKIHALQYPKKITIRNTDFFEGFEPTLL
jgi:hypothetical protein